MYYDGSDARSARLYRHQPLRLIGDVAILTNIAIICAIASSPSSSSPEKLSGVTSEGNSKSKTRRPARATERGGARWYCVLQMHTPSTRLASTYTHDWCELVSAWFHTFALAKYHATPACGAQRFPSSIVACAHKCVLAGTAEAT